MRRAPGNLARFLLVQTLSELEAFRRVVAAGMQRAYRSRKFAHLQKELRCKGLHPVGRDLTFADLAPQRMPSKRAALFDHREQFSNETLAGCCHDRPRLAGNSQWRGKKRITAPADRSDRVFPKMGRFPVSSCARI